MHLTKETNRTIFIIIALYCAYCLMFILNTSNVMEGQRYYNLLDDAMISMRYASNLADGYGPYYNIQNERVEGYTNPLWVGLMSVVHFIHNDKTTAPLIVQLIGLILLIVNLLYVSKLASLLSSCKKEVIILSVILTAFFHPVNVWSLGGMEVSAIICIITASVYYLYKSSKEQKLYYQIIWLPALATMFRPDSIILLIFFYFFGTWKLKGVRKEKFEKLFAIILFMLVFVNIAYRLYFFDEFFPNTYFLKMTGYPLLERIFTGLKSTLSIMLFVILPQLIFLVWYFLKFKPSKYKYIIALLITIAIYNIYIGGDAGDWWGGTNRFISSVMPLFFVMFSDALIMTLQASKIKYIKSTNSYLTIFAISTVIIFQLNSFGFTNSIKEFLLMKQPIFMADAEFLTRLALAVQKTVPKQASVAVVTAGTLPYHLKNPIIDLLGKNDKIIGKMNSRISGIGLRRYLEYNPGHNKWDYSYSIGHLKPDVVAQLWSHHDEALPYLSRYYNLVKVDGIFFFIKK